MSVWRKVGLLLALLALPAYCASDAVLTLVGKGAGATRYRGGGKVEFLDVSLADQLVHIGDGREIPLRLSIGYNVLETAPVLLTSRLGSEYWTVYHYASESAARLYTRENIDLSRAGEATATAKRAWTAKDERLSKGLVSIRSRRYFLIDQPNGKWLDVVDPPPFFSRPEVALKLTFTLANLERFSLSFAEVRSTWKPGAGLYAMLVVTDADGERFPVLCAEGRAEAGAWRAPLVPVVQQLLHVPAGWVKATLPQNVPDQVTLSATVSAMTPSGPKVVRVQRVVRRGEGQTASEGVAAPVKLPELPRNAQGVVRETRAMWVAMRDITTRAGIEDVVRRAARARLNMLVPNVFVRSSFVCKSDLFPMAESVEEGLDPLAYLIELAHKDGLEVHPWFCVTYRDAKARELIGGVDLIQKNGKPATHGACVHRPKYREFIVNLMTDVARRYDVDGVHLDYIRSMGDCYCEACQREFKEKFGKPMSEATEEEWVAWHREAVGDIVRRVAENVRRVRPRAKMSAAVFSSLSSGARQGQDPAGWARNGWLDIVIPMDYKLDTMLVQTCEKSFLDVLDNDDCLVSGLSMYMRQEGQAVPRPPELVAEQITLVRSLGIHGYCLFVSSYLTDEIIARLREEINTEPAVPYFR